MAEETTQYAPLKNDLLLRAARGEKVERPPVWIMRQAGRYLPEYHEVKAGRDFFETCRDPEIASEITIQPVDHYDGLIDAAIIFSDILVIPQAMGMAVEIREKTGPFFPDPMREPEDIERLLSPEVDVTKELAWAFDAISTTRRKLNGRVPLLGFCGGPFTLLVYMTEGGSTKLYRYIRTWIYKYPEAAKQVLQRITDVAVEFLAQQVKAGAQMLQVFESWAGEIGPAEFAEFSLPYLRQIAERLPRRLHELGLVSDPERNREVPVTIFAKGAWYALDDLANSAYNAISIDWLHDPAQAVKTVDGRATLQGNLDPGVIYGSKETITRKVEQMIAGFGGGKQNYIINLGHGTQPFFDPEMVGFFLEECHRVGSL